MSKIEEMAEKYANETYSHPIAIEASKANFIIGANAVLEEIERTMSVSEDGWLESNLKRLVNELKG